MLPSTQVTFTMATSPPKYQGVSPGFRFCGSSIILPTVVPNP
jgi:hypothetical protein